MILRHEICHSTRILHISRHFPTLKFRILIYYHLSIIPYILNRHPCVLNPSILAQDFNEANLHLYVYLFYLNQPLLMTHQIFWMITLYWTHLCYWCLLSHYVCMRLLLFILLTLMARWCIQFQSFMIRRNKMYPLLFIINSIL